MKIPPTARLTLIALERHNPLTLGQLSEFTGSTPFYLQSATARWHRHGFIDRVKIDGIYHIFIAGTAPTPAAD